MAKKKKKSARSEPKPEVFREDVDQEVDDDGDEEPDVAEASPAKEPKAAKRTDHGTAPLPAHVPNPDGDHVSANGGLIFMGVILTLMAIAIGVQFFVG